MEHHGAANEGMGFSRRDFVRTAAASAVIPLAAGAMGAGVSQATAAVARGANVAGKEEVRIGVIGCGGRGTGAAGNALEAWPQARIVALADVFAERVESAKSGLAGNEDASMAARGKVADGMCFTGWDAYQKLLASKEVDSVILATPPHFRPIHFAAAIAAGKHVFMEKPVAVDPTGIRKVLAAAEEATKRKLCVVAGTQRRHEPCYRAAMKKMAEGAIGQVVAARCFWNMGSLWMNPRQPNWSDMEWQLRNWLYFTWLSGDHIVEQHVHNIDVVNWAFGAHPTRAIAVGGRQVRTEAAYGHIFDHFGVSFEYPDGRFALSMCRQTDGTDGRVAEYIHGTNGVMSLSSGSAECAGKNAWRFSEDNGNPYVIEHVDLYSAMTGKAEYINEGRQVAESTLSAIMARMSAYTGKDVTWEQALNSKLDLSPPKYEFGSLPTPPVPTPGKTPLE